MEYRNELANHSIHCLFYMRCCRVGVLCYTKPSLKDVPCFIRNKGRGSLPLRRRGECHQTRQLNRTPPQARAVLQKVPGIPAVQRVTSNRCQFVNGGAASRLIECGKARDGFLRSSPRNSLRRVEPQQRFERGRLFWVKRFRRFIEGQQSRSLTAGNRGNWAIFCLHADELHPRSAPSSARRERGAER